MNVKQMRNGQVEKERSATGLSSFGCYRLLTGGIIKTFVETVRIANVDKDYTTATSHLNACYESSIPRTTQRLYPLTSDCRTAWVGTACLPVGSRQ